MAFRLPRMIVIRSNYYSSRGNFYYREADGSVVLGEPSVFSTLVKIEVERAASHDRYVHLRFSHSNRYWQRKVNDQFIECVSTKPEEDTSNPSCTLFEPVEVPNGNGMFYLTHVQSGGRLLIHDPVNNPTMALYVNMSPGSDQGYLTFLNWETLVKLPGRVAFKGDNDMFLQGATLDRLPYLQFSSDDPNTRSSGHEVTLMPDDRHVRIRSDHFGQFWRLMPNWIRAEAGVTTPENRDTLFWPVKIDANTIGLRSAGNNNFCKRLSADRKTSCLNASADTLTREARLGVQELVEGRRIYNVRYRMQDARIFDESPYLAGSTTLFNDKDVEAAVAVAITYEEESSYSFSRSVSLTAGVTSTISFGLPSIVGGSIEVSYQVNTTLEWENTTTTKTSVTSTGSVPVPPRSTALVSFVGTRGTCNIPFHYTQQDRSSTGAGIVETEQIDGIYTGVNCYNFHFVVERTERIA